MRKGLTCLLILVTILSLIGCGGGGGGSTPTSGTSPGSIEGYVWSNGSTFELTGINSTPGTGFAASSGATVTTDDGKTTTTGNDGKFRLDNVAAGNRTVTIVKGSLTRAVAVTVNSGQTTTTFTGTIVRDITGTTVSLAGLSPQNVYGIFSMMNREEGNFSNGGTLTVNTNLNSSSSAPKLSPKAFNVSKSATQNTKFREVEKKILQNRGTYKSAAKSLAVNKSVSLNQVDQFWMLNSSGGQDQISATCVKVGASAYIYVDNADLAKINDTIATDFINSWDNSIYNKVRAAFGNETQTSDKVYILFSSKVRNNVNAQGYFFSIDKLSEATAWVLGFHSNEKSIFYVNAETSYGSVNINATKGLLAHEFQHMINFDNHYINGGTEQDWLNEGLAMFAQYVVGFTPNAAMLEFLNNPGSLTIWQGTDSNYGAGSLFVRYLYEQYGGAVVKNLVSSNRGGIANVEAATGVNFDTIYRNWVTALYLSNSGLSSDPKYNFTTVSLRTGGMSGLQLYQSTPVNMGSGFTTSTTSYKPIALKLGNLGTSSSLTLSGSSPGGVIIATK